MLNVDHATLDMQQRCYSNKVGEWLFCVCVLDYDYDDDDDVMIEIKVLGARTPTRKGPSYQ